MAIINPIIPLQVETPERKSYQQVEAERLELQSRRLKAQEDRQGFQDRQLLRSALQESGGDLEKALPKIMQVSPQFGLEVQKELNSLREHTDRLKKERSSYEMGILKFVEESDSENERNKRIYAIKKVDPSWTGADELLKTPWEPSHKQKMDEATAKRQDEVAKDAREDKGTDNKRLDLQQIETERHNREQERIASSDKGSDNTRQDDQQKETERHNRETERIGTVRANRPPSEPIVAVIGPDGKPVYAPRSGAVGQTPAPTGAAARGRLSAVGVEKIAGIDQTLGVLNVLRDLKKDEWLGPLAGRATELSVKVPGVPVSRELARFTAETATLKNSVIKAITGAQMSNFETARILAQVPLFTDKPVVWEEKMRSTQANLAMLKKRWIELSGGTDTSPITESEGAPKEGDTKPPKVEEGWIDLGNGIRVRKK